MLRNCAVEFVEICNVYVQKMIIKAAKRIFNSDNICCSYSDLNFGVTFLEHSVHLYAIGTMTSVNIVRELLLQERWNRTYIQLLNVHTGVVSYGALG